MFESFLAFLSTNKVIIVGATATVAEVVTILINFVRKNRAISPQVTMQFGNKLLWAANPLNLFRKA